MFGQVQEPYQCEALHESRKVCTTQAKKLGVAQSKSRAAYCLHA
jgi:hypothetical protein